MKLAEVRSPVVALALFDSEGLSARPHGEMPLIQIVVRDPTTNRTHPNVVSVPTARVPKILFDALLQDVSVESRHGYTSLCSSRDLDSEDATGHNPVIFVVKSILAQKLGAGDALEAGLLAFRARVGALSFGESQYYNADEPTSELIAMVTIVVTLTKGADVFPSQTASYSHLRWVSTNQFVKAVQNKDPSLVNLHPIDLCIHGLCVSSTYDLIASKSGLKPFANLYHLSEE